MELRRWQKKVIDEFPEIVKNYKKFILKAPTGAGKTVLASEIINKFYKNQKIIVLCHRLVLLEQLEKGLSTDHKVKKLGLSEVGDPFIDYDVLISTNLRSRDFLLKAIKECDLLIIDEAHRVSPNGQAYKELLIQFDKESKNESKLSPVLYISSHFLSGVKCSSSPFLIISFILSIVSGTTTNPSNFA